MGQTATKEYKEDVKVDESTDCEPYDMTIMAPWDNLWIDDSFINKLPNELLNRIFRKLSFNDLQQLRLVCKRWYTLMRLPEFMSKAKLVISHENIDCICDTLRKDKKFRRVLAYEHVEFLNLKANEDMKLILRSIRSTLRELVLNNTPVLIDLHEYVSRETTVHFSGAPGRKVLRNADYENSTIHEFGYQSDHTSDDESDDESDCVMIESDRVIGSDPVIERDRIRYRRLRTVKDDCKRRYLPSDQKRKIHFNLQRSYNIDIDCINIPRRNLTRLPKSNSELSGNVDQFKNVDSLNEGFRNLSLGKKRNIQLTLPGSDNILSNNLNEFTNMNSLDTDQKERHIQLTILRELHPNIKKLSIELNEKHQQLLFHVLERNRDTLKYWEFNVQASPAMIPKWKQLFGLLYTLESLKSRWSLLVQ